MPYTRGKNPKSWPTGEFAQTARRWLGENASYSSIHKWITVHYGRASRCQNHNCLGFSTNFDWCNISKEYHREMSDWIQLCRSCHRLFDNGKLQLTDVR